MRRTAIPGLLLMFLSLSGCTYFCGQSTCGGNNQAPIVCISANGHATPDPVHVKRGQWLHFFAPSGDLTIEDVDGILESPGHDGSQAWGRVRKNAAPGKHHYRVNLGGKSYDPDVMIDPVVP